MSTYVDISKLAAGFGLRLAGLALFLPLAVPFMVVQPLTLLCAGLAALVLGAEGERTDRILLNRVARWSVSLPLWLFAKAGQVQQGAIGK